MRIAAGRWALEVRPQRGGRITSLRLDGEELLDQGIGVDQPTADGFVEGGAQGWDEMVPNLDPTDTLPDHGEAWRLPWTVVVHSRDGIGMSCDGNLVPWRLGRRIFLGSTVDLFYEYTNVGTEPHDAFWCAHPLFKYEPGIQVGAPVPGEVPEGSSTKVFQPQGAVEHVTLGWRSGAQIEMSWDPFLVRNVAIWMCNGDLGGYRQIAIEPSWTRRGLRPGETCSWWLKIAPLN
ncbi:MAG TPA: hypothetical protein VEN12_00770 [Verrucomicrobiae bacterium]|nr:hypothetical protein [Verrucomicrobiae bacterium]